MQNRRVPESLPVSSPPASPVGSPGSDSALDFRRQIAALEPNQRGLGIPAEPFSRRSLQGLDPQLVLSDGVCPSNRCFRIFPHDILCVAAHGGIPRG